MFKTDVGLLGVLEPDDVEADFWLQFSGFLAFNFPEDMAACNAFLKRAEWRLPWLIKARRACLIRLPIKPRLLFRAINLHAEIRLLKCRSRAVQRYIGYLHMSLGEDNGSLQ